MPELKTVLISGASEGIGRCFAEVFARQGHDLILVACNQQKLEQLATELRAHHGVQVTVLATDLIPADAARLLFECLNQKQLPVDIKQLLSRSALLI